MQSEACAALVFGGVWLYAVCDKAIVAVAGEGEEEGGGRVPMARGGVRAAAGSGCGDGCGCGDGGGDVGGDDVTDDINVDDGVC